MKAWEVLGESSAPDGTDIQSHAFNQGATLFLSSSGSEPRTSTSSAISDSLGRRPTCDVSEHGAIGHEIPLNSSGSQRRNMSRK